MGGLRGSECNGPPLEPQGDAVTKPGRCVLTASYTNKNVILIPNQATLMRFPEESKVDTSSGMPNKLSVIVSVPLALTVSVPLNKKSKNASKGGTFKAGGAGG